MVLTGAALGSPHVRAVTDPQLGTAAVDRPRILLWGNGAFVGRASFEAWLQQHHQRYATWAAAHPSGRSVLALSVLPSGFRPSQLAPTKGPAFPLTLVDPIERSPSRPRFRLDVLLLVLGGLMAVAAVTLPLGEGRPSVAYALAERRLAVFMAGSAILIGVAIAKLMS
jgi:hypothetical protein